MGWLWSSNKKGDNGATKSPADGSPSAPSPPRLLEEGSLGPRDSATTDEPAKSRSLTRDELEAEEISQFIAEFEADAARERASTARRSPNPNSSSVISRFAGQFTSRKSSTNDSSPSSSEETPPLRLFSHPNRDHNDITFSTLAEESLSCRTAFDYAFHCQSFGGQFTNLYRYGEVRSCSHLWSEFWLCMRAKRYPEDERRGMVKRHNVDKLQKWGKGPSSEDVWDVRERRVESVGENGGERDGVEPFQGDFVGLEKRIEEWKRRQQAMDSGIEKGRDE